MATKVLVINCGSSSIKYRLFDMADEKELASGLVERIGQPPAAVKHKTGSWKYEGNEDIHDAETGIRRIVKLLADPHDPVLQDADELLGVGHRVLHGGEAFQDPTLVDDDVLKKIEEMIPLGPLHNPANLAGIRAAQHAFAAIPQVSVFDTGFFQTLPPQAYIYAVPYEWYEKYRIRRYGFHGTSHRYVSARAAQILSKPQANLITLHLGNGCSMACIKNGKAIDTTMGLTPLEGLVMGSRSGDIDPAIVFHLAERGVLNYQQVRDALEKKSGLMGISGVSRDMRDVGSAAAAGNERAVLALKVFAHRARKYVGAFLAELGRCDGIVFTGGIGENDIAMRQMILEGLEPLGISLDAAANRSARGETRISTADSKVTILVVPTNEELMIARDTVRLIKQTVGASR
jgi:acetate kinase